MQAVSSADTRGRWWANEARDAAGGRAARSKGVQAGRRWRRRRAVCGRHVQTCLHRSQLCMPPGRGDRRGDPPPSTIIWKARAPAERHYLHVGPIKVTTCLYRSAVRERGSIGRAPWAGLAGRTALPTSTFSSCTRGHNIGRGWCGERRQEATPAGGVALVAENPP